MVATVVLPSSSRWYEIASDLEVQLRGVQQGSRDSAIAQFGQDRQLALETLRAYAAARRHLEDIGTTDPELASALRMAPFDAVNALARWRQWDPKGAWEGAKRVAAKEMSVREVRKRAKPADGREMPVSSKQTLIKRILGNKGIYWPTSDEDDILVNHDDALVEFGRSNAPQWSIRRESIYKMGGDLRPATNDVIRNRRIDLFAHNDNEGDDRRVAILVVGPYSVREYYSRRHVDWVLIAVAATHFYANVALFFSDDADIAPFQRWLRIQDPRAELKISLVRETDAGFRIVARSEARNRGVADNAEGSKEGANNEEHGEEAQESMPEEDVVAVISLEEGIGEPKPEMPED